MTDTPPPSTGLAEKDVLVGFLDYLRTSAATKVEGVPEPVVRTPGVPSGTNLLGLIKHLAHVERYTFLGEHVDDWQATFHATPEETVEGLVAVAPRRCAESLTHMIEETGRHAGHLDILRELADGATGR